MSRCSRLVDSDATETDVALERHFARLRGELRPDPLFRRRLRSHAINHFVASRERHDVRELSSGRQSRMGRLGRASLFASVALAMSAAAVLGVSQEALPGDPLYGVKLRVEELRFTVAPAELQPMLVAVVVGERLEEMSRLVDAGRLDDAVAMGPVVKREIERLADSGHGGDGVARVAHQLQVLDELINRLPPQAQAAIRRSWDELTSRPGAGEPSATTSPGGADSGGNGSASGAGPGSGDDSSAGGAGGGGGAGGTGGAGGAGPGGNSSGNLGGNSQGGSGGSGNGSGPGGSKHQDGNSGGAPPSQDPPRDNAHPTPKGSPSSE